MAEKSSAAPYAATPWTKIPVLIASKEAESQLGALDKQTAQKLLLRREVERVRERMTLKHKSTSRWAKRALKQQQKNQKKLLRQK